ncbi:MAG TPA: DEAD/DEAH box helicase [Polyangiaceae bacterium]
MSLFRLHPHLQHAIVNDLGWRELRPVQSLTIDAVLDGANSVVLAPTAGGKTEAAIFPVLSQILTEQRKPVSVLYVCPIKALLNNQEERLRQYARMVGLDVFKWHGDVSASAKDKFRRDPAHVLLTTPESIEVMLISAKTDARALFANLGTVVVDEVHAFAGDDRGAHLISLLERLSAFCGRDIQRIGLSATVGNPQVIGQWLQGSSQRPFRLVDPPRSAAIRDLHLDFAEDLTDAAARIATLARGRKSLIFVESRSRAEKVAQALGGSGVDVFIHHSSVSRADRTLAEERFTHGSNTAIVATSTMELGIDVGDLDQVIQVDAPGSVASFLQRIGRTGRRAGSRSNCTFFCLTPESLLQAVALMRLAESGWVEDVAPAEGALHVLAHQILALTLQEGGISRHAVLPMLGEAWPFASLREHSVHELVDTMVERQILYEADGLLSLGQRGERLYGRKNFFELYAVFSSPPMLRVQSGREEVGHVSAWFVQGHDEREGALCFRLGGRAWQVAHVDWGKAILDVRPAERGQVPTWLGMGGVLSQPLCRAMMQSLMAPGPETAWLSTVAQRTLDELRVGYEGLLEEGTASLEDQGENVQWHTFAGGGVNRLLAAGLEVLTGDKWIAGNLTLKSKAAGIIKARDAVRQLRNLDWETLAPERAHDLARGRLSKFQPCLPQHAEDRLLAERLLDVPGTLRFLGTVRVGGERIGAIGGGRRVDIALNNGPALVPDASPGVVAAYRARNPALFIDGEQEFEAICRELAQAPIVALDVETTLDTHALCLIQLGVPGRVVMIDPLALPTLEPLRGVLESHAVVKVVHNASFERGVFARLGYNLINDFDTLTASRNLRGRDALGGHSLRAVCERELGFTLDKSAQTSTWARRPLSAEQLAYAAADVEVLLPIYDLFRPLVSKSTAPPAF